MLTTPSHEHFMKMAIQEAQLALEADEVPVGAVIVCEGQIIARAHNLTERLNDFTAHAEMQAFTAASDYLGGKYLDKCTLYVTLEPCVMCGGAGFWTRIGHVVFGAYDLKRGAGRFRNSELEVLHPKTTWTGGILETECSEIITTFFARKRQGY